MPKYNYAPGDQPIDDYTIQYALGRGGFGEVYFATSKAGREVALKAVLHHEDVELRGVQNCMNLQSSRLLTIYDIKRDSEGVLWIVMEFVRGPSLQDIISESPDGLGSEQALYLLKELALGLSDLHNAGIVHRDLKPSNIFFDGGRARVGDYSLSKTISNHEQSQHTITVGSVHYMAPEISLGKYDKTVDIYALGVIFFEMLCGQPPHTGETVGEILLKHLNVDVDVDSIDSDFQSVVQRAMNRDPSARYQSAEEMVRDAFESVDPSTLVDSFSPMTLSLIGERAQQRKQFSTMPISRSGVSEVVQPDRLLPKTDSSMPGISRSIEIRLLLAGAVTFLTTTIAILTDNRAGLGAIDGLQYGLATLCGSMVPVYGILRWPQGHVESRRWRGWLRRLLMAVGSASLWCGIAVWLTPIEFEGLFIASVGCGLALLLIDWSKATAVDRSHSLRWRPTVIAVAVAVGLCFLLRMPEWWIFSAATTLGVVLSLQLATPFGGPPETSTLHGKLGLEHGG